MRISIERLLRSLRKLRGHRPLYEIGDMQVRLTPDHLLPVHQAQNPLYDRFLPFLAGQLKAGDAVIDVGANCGDTLAAMLARNAALDYFCVEADDGFFELLTENIGRFKAAHSNTRIEAVKALAGTAQTTGILVGKGGTMHLQEGRGVGSRSLEALVADLNFAPTDSEATLLIKSDVDGFDHDVIRSAGALLRRPKTMLFYECHCTNELQATAYTALFHDLCSLGYRDAWVFDNFGNPLMHCASAHSLADLVRHLERQRQGRSRRTFSYIDILCCNEDAAELARASVAGFEAAIAAGRA
jgi:FkbM family methyltransferase